MKFTADCDLWLHALKAFTTFIQSLTNTTIADQAITLDAGSDCLTISVRSRTQRLAHILPATIKKPGVVTIPFIPFSTFLKELHTATFTITVTTKGCIITTPHNTTCTLNLTPVSPDDLPCFPTPLQTPDLSFAIPSTQSAAALNAMLPFVDDHHTNPKLQGFSFHLCPSPSPHLTIVGSDGHRLAKYEHRLDTFESTKQEPTELLISKDTIQILLQLSKHACESDSWVVTSSSHHTTFTVGTATLTTVLLAGPYVSYHDILPHTLQPTIALSSQAFYEAVRRLHALNSANDHPIVITTNDLTLTIATHDHTIGDGHVTIDTHYASLPHPIMFNTKYLLDLLRGFDHETIEWSSASSHSPSCFTSATNPALLFLIMPIRG